MFPKSTTPDKQASQPKQGSKPLITNCFYAHTPQPKNGSIFSNLTNDKTLNPFKISNAQSKTPEKKGILKTNPS